MTTSFPSPPTKMPTEPSCSAPSVWVATRWPLMEKVSCEPMACTLRVFVPLPALTAGAAVQGTMSTHLSPSRRQMPYSPLSPTSNT